ncbi:DNA polymerase III subunit delta [Spirochaetia bacterium 38H-sp]|uniref:DNA polymerase III subunit delta n=1 Tax=Rarispira pelagica TaxID=3141764 RepID=A0ABU9U9C9_9SPIR
MAKISPIYTLLGPETGQKKEKIEEIKLILKKQKGPIETEHFYADEISFSEILPKLETTGLFSAHNLIIIENADSITGKDVSLLSSYLDTPGKQTTVIFLSEKTKLGTGIEKKLKKYPFEIFWELGESNRISIIQKILRDNGLKIDREALELFLELIAPQSEQIKEECSRLTSFFPKGHNITEKDIERFLYHSREETIFSLFSFIAARDLNKTLESAKTLTNQSTSGVYQITGGLLWQLRKVLAIKKMTARGYHRDDALLKCGIRGISLKKDILNADKNYSTKEIKQAISLVISCDKKLRLYRKELHENIFLQTLYKIITHESLKIR